METNVDVQKRYAAALDAFIKKVKRDRNIIAAIVAGSFSYDQVWEKSDIDLMLILQDGAKPNRENSCFVEDSVHLSVWMMFRNQFKRMLEGALSTSFEHSFFSKSRLLFSKDETISEYYRNVHHIGARDKEFQLLGTASLLLPNLTKAEKWFYVKRDWNYSFFWLMRVIDELAKIEVILNDEIPTREVIHQAIRHNPGFFNAIYTELLNVEKNEENVGQAIDLINDYLQNKTFILFVPILDYLCEAGGIRTRTELNDYFMKRARITPEPAYQWLAQKGIIEEVSSPCRITKNSQVEVQEPAYYYADDGIEEESVNGKR